MNFNAIIAVLILKSVITEDEGERLVEHLNDKPQSTVLRDAIAAVAEVIGKPQPAILPHIGPVGPAQQAEEAAARALPQPPLDPSVAQPVSPNQEPELAANEATLDADQADKPDVLDEQAADEEVAKNTPASSDTASEDKPATDEPAKSTSDNKPKEATKKK
jgi:hypothetical protein